MKADPTTWGNHKACFVLADKLNGMYDVKLIARINKIISTFSNHLRAVRALEKYKERTINILSEYYSNNILSDKYIPNSIKSYVLNILHRQASRYKRGEPSSNDKTRNKKLK